MPHRLFLPVNVLGGLTWAPGLVYAAQVVGTSHPHVERLAGRASLLLGVAVIGVLAVTLTARWVIRHPHRALAPLRRLRAHPTVDRLEHRYARQLDFLAQRFNPATALGLALTAQLAILGALGAAFGAVTEDVIAGDDVVRLDDPISRYVIAHREPWLTRVMEAVTDLGSALVLVPALVLFGLIARRAAGSWRPLGILAASFGGATATYTVVKLLIARPRPQSGALVDALGYAFPSGHTTQATAGWLGAAVVLGWLSGRHTVRVVLIAVAATIAVAVGVSRVYLGVHAPTDVLGGWALGGAWLAGVLLTASLLSGRERRAAADHAPPTTGNRTKAP